MFTRLVTPSVSVRLDMTAAEPLRLRRSGLFVMLLNQTVSLLVCRVDGFFRSSDERNVAVSQ